VTDFNDARCGDLASDLLETMRAAPGIEDHRAAYRQSCCGPWCSTFGTIEGARTYVNPEIILGLAPRMILHREGSVSMPGVNDEVERHARIRISYQDVYGNMQTEEDSDGLRAVCHQHEIDQLNGGVLDQPVIAIETRERLVKRV